MWNRTKKIKCNRMFNAIQSAIHQYALANANKHLSTHPSHLTLLDGTVFLYTLERGLICILHGCTNQESSVSIKFTMIVLNETMINMVLRWPLVMISSISTRSIYLKVAFHCDYSFVKTHQPTSISLL